MARKTKVVLVDDLDGSVASQTVRFALDGTNYEIDLNDENAEKLREQLKFWTKAGRRARSTRGARAATPGSTINAKVRAWAKAEGIEVNERGRVSEALKNQYFQANNA